ncbi:hypothetical protein JTB14_015219 [Gonioctena quinquepunctata]|nr:hypothetical protein JTB14_015219 [Gonioctena quinquepunctata]
MESQSRKNTSMCADDFSLRIIRRTLNSSRLDPQKTLVTAYGYGFSDFAMSEKSTRKLASWDLPSGILAKHPPIVTRTSSWIFVVISGEV